MKNLPAFNYVVREKDDTKIVVIIDEYDEDYPTQSVTNGVEKVIDIIVYELGYIPDYWVYLDTAKEWDEIVLNHSGLFVRFAPIPREFQSESEIVNYIIAKQNNKRIFKVVS